MKSMKVLIFLIKTYLNWCVTLDSEVERKKVRTIIENIVDIDHDEKIGQLAWAGSGSQKWADIYCINCPTETRKQRNWVSLCEAGEFGAIVF